MAPLCSAVLMVFLVNGVFLGPPMKHNPLMGLQALHNISILAHPFPQLLHPFSASARATQASSFHSGFGHHGLQASNSHPIVSLPHPLRSLPGMLNLVS